MSTTAELNKAMRARLETAGIPFHEINVFGVIRCNVHVRCLGVETAERWQMLLCQVFKGARVNVVKTSWHAAENKNTSMRPTMRHGYLVAVAA